MQMRRWLVLRSSTIISVRFSFDVSLFHWFFIDFSLFFH